MAGSPPHMRGKARMIPIHVNGERITPAHAGKSSKLPNAEKFERDHPRTCGEKGGFQRRLQHGGGSPPHMRGKGNLFFFITLHKKDHPRTCGEKD